MKKGVDYIGVAVGAMIFNAQGKLFLSKRGRRARNERGCWEIPGGSVEWGEKMEYAIKREMREEYGISIELVEQLPATNHLIKKENQHWVPTCFIAKLKGKKIPKILEPEKCDAIGWFSLKNLPKPLSIVTKLDLKNYQRKIAKNNKQLLVVNGCVFRHGKVLMVQRDQATVPDSHLKWELPGGKVEFGETTFAAVEREVLEETGVKVKALKLARYISGGLHPYFNGHDQGVFHSVVVTFKCKYLLTAKMLPDRRVKQIAWVALDKIKQLDSLPGTGESIRACLNQL